MEIVSLFPSTNECEAALSISLDVSQKLINYRLVTENVIWKCRSVKVILFL